MRVLHLISSAGWYGAENVLVNLAAVSRSLGCDARNPHTEVAEHAQARGVPAEIAHCHGRLDFHTIGELRRWLVRKSVGIVHTHNYESDSYAAGALRGRSTGWITTCYNGTDRTRNPADEQGVCRQSVLPGRSNAYAAPGSVRGKPQS
jgi:hypothetical protein